MKRPRSLDRLIKVLNAVCADTKADGRCSGECDSIGWCDEVMHTFWRMCDEAMIGKDEN